MNLGVSIKVALAKRGMSHKALADEMGVLQSSLSQLINRGSCPSTTIEKLAAIFGMKVSEFIALGEE